MSMVDVLAALETDKLESEDTTSMDSTSFCKICLIDNQKNLLFQPIKTIAALIRTRNRTFPIDKIDKQG